MLTALGFGMVITFMYCDNEQAAFAAGLTDHRAHCVRIGWRLRLQHERNDA